MGIALLTDARTRCRLRCRSQVDFWWFAVEAAAIVTLVFAAARLRQGALLVPREVRCAQAQRRASWACAAHRCRRSRAPTRCSRWRRRRSCCSGGSSGSPSRANGSASCCGCRTPSEPFFYPVLALCVVELVRLGVDLVRPYRTLPRVALRLVLNLAWLALFVLAYRTEGFVEIAENTARRESGERPRDGADLDEHHAVRARLCQRDSRRHGPRAAGAALGRARLSRAAAEFSRCPRPLRAAP